MSQKTTSNIIVAAIFTFIGCTFSYFLFFQDKIDECKESLVKAELNLSECLTQNESIKKDDNELKHKINEKKIELIYKDKEIKILNVKLEDKESTIDDLKLEIKEKEKIIKENFEELKAAIQNGATEQMRNKLNEYGKEMDKLHSEKSKLINKLETLQEDIEQEQSIIRDKEKEIEILNKVTIPKLKDSISQLEEQAAVIEESNQHLNLRAEIENIEIDKKSSQIRFNLMFNSNEVKYLKKKNNDNRITFLTEIFNKTKNRPIYNDNSSSLGLNQISETITITFPVKREELKKYKNKKRGINYRKGDHITIKVFIEQLNLLEVSSTSFYLN